MASGPMPAPNNFLSGLQRGSNNAFCGQAKSVLAAKGEGRKVQQLASIFREVKFMERYENEAQAREQRRQQLADHGAALPLLGCL